jgi:hypothetical protein
VFALHLVVVSVDRFKAAAPYFISELVFSFNFQNCLLIYEWSLTINCLSLRDQNTNHLQLALGAF